AGSCPNEHSIRRYRRIEIRLHLRGLVDAKIIGRVNHRVNRSVIAIECPVNGKHRISLAGNVGDGFIDLDETRGDDRVNILAAYNISEVVHVERRSGGPWDQRIARGTLDSRPGDTRAELIFEFRSDGSATVDAENHDVLKMGAVVAGVEPCEHQFRGFRAREWCQSDNDGQNDQCPSFQFHLSEIRRTLKIDVWKAQGSTELAEQPALLQIERRRNHCIERARCVIY